jgi:hypothetical protein
MFNDIKNIKNYQKQTFLLGIKPVNQNLETFNIKIAALTLILLIKVINDAKLFILVNT